MDLNLAQRTGSIIRSTRAMKDSQVAESHKSPLCLFGVAGFRQFFLSDAFQAEKCIEEKCIEDAAWTFQSSQEANIADQRP